MALKAQNKRRGVLPTWRGSHSPPSRESRSAHLGRPELRPDRRDLCRALRPTRTAAETIGAAPLLFQTRAWPSECRAEATERLGEGQHVGPSALFSHAADSHVFRITSSQSFVRTCPAPSSPERTHPRVTETHMERLGLLGRLCFRSAVR